MKKHIETPSVDLIQLCENDIVTGSISGLGMGGSIVNGEHISGDAPRRGFVFFDDGSYEGEVFNNDYDYSSHYEEY